MIDHILGVVEYVAVGIELPAIAVIVVGIVWATYSCLTRENVEHAESRGVLDRVRLGRTVLVGLEVLVAADMMRTDALEPSLEGVATSGCG